MGKVDGARISVDQVSVMFGGTPGLLPVSFNVAPATSVAVTGPNGAGKTTLLQALAGTLAPTTGAVVIDGLPADERNPEFRSRVATLIGPPPLAHNLTLAEHLSLVGLSWRLTSDGGRRRGMDILDAFGVAELANRFPHELSSGQTQMFALAVTLVRPFDVLLLDEPEQRLDADRVLTLAALLEAHRQRGAALIVSSHDVTLTEALGSTRVDLGLGTVDRAE